MVEQNLTIEDCFRKSDELKKQQKFKLAIEYKLREIELLKQKPQQDSKYPKEINIARSYQTLARFSYWLGDEDLNIKSLLKAHVRLWKFYKNKKLFYKSEIKEIRFVTRILLKKLPHNTPTFEKLAFRYNDLIYNVGREYWEEIYKLRKKTKSKH